MSASSLASAAFTTPLTEERLAALGRVTEGLDTLGLWWLSGFAAGLASRAGAIAPFHDAPVHESPAPEASPAGRLTIVYGSQTGNAKRLAEQLARQGEAAGLPVRLLRADAYPTRELKDECNLYLVISTQGDGDPPDDARGLVEFISGRRAPELKQLRYAVLGLGDSSYPQFCAIGQKLDARLAELGATRLLPRGDADLDLETIATPWVEQALARAKEALKPAAPLATVTPLRPLPPSAPHHHRDAPFSAELLLNQRITGSGSTKDIRHIELSLESSGLHYEPGDAIGVWPSNAPELVDEVLTTLALDGITAVTHDGQTLPVRQWLSEKRELTRLARPFLASHAAQARSEELNGLLAPGQQANLAGFLGRTQVLDLLQQHPADWSAEEFVAALRPLTPRLYSIASSRKQVGDEAHLTVAHVEYTVDRGTRWGAASHQLAASADGAFLSVFVEHNERFRLPADTTRDVIMIGPGTGVAPFRGFVQERAATRPTTAGAGGRNWLLFGNPYFRSDFLYQVEWQQALKDGRLHRLDLAFSRDQAQKVYVQDRMREQGRELFDWLEGGAHLYVCGDATRMARDVHASLLATIAEHGGKSAEAAEEYLSNLQQQGRYARDVY
ncbi:sulfite reductase (NADPH) flavoprotein alpha-component [Lysobacter niastensis]|uniref:Sulfite reductase [NADPH] flavoprotein alpha-component n=1 Tax=Lysobacter niastensis TaxID=380629 RepID=A0ABU1W863_9GAMM|nr:assimilatory sulfite reductase (NADPH) flavoprotein subunit [Lysobacter niastensis]MDR7133798.1 sulfite reductase (NADPH) flavoprotein alpha-component [Lysobacter niastensis]